jgi:hypothetical protein
VADAGNEGTDGDAVEASVCPGVADGVADAEADAAGDDVAGGVVADAQALIANPTRWSSTDSRDRGRMSMSSGRYAT